MVNKEKYKSFFEKLQIPENESTKKHQFLFNVYNPKSDGLIFLITSLFIPIIAIFIFRFVGGMGTNNISNETNSYLQMGYLLVTIICSIVGMIIFIKKDSRLLSKSGLIVFYLFQLIPNACVLIGSFILTIIYGQNTSTNSTANILSIWFQILGELIVVWFAFKLTIDLKARVIETFKNNWKTLIIVVVIGIIILAGVCGFAWDAIFKNTVLGEKSTNQNELEKLLKDDNLSIRVSYAFTLVVLTCFVAPIAEELATRNSWYIGCGNRSVAWITSAIYFALLHVQTGDVEHMLNYFVAGLILSSVFNITRGNVTYDWLVHMGYNTLMLAIILAN